METEDRSVFDLPYSAPTKTFSYGKSDEQVIDFYLPAESNKPIIVLIHGGYWRPEYDRKHLAPLAQKFAELGWPVALIEYRRIIGNPDATFDDVLSAIKEVSGQYEKAFLIGHSAGGHLALLSANSFEVKGVIALAPVCDLLKAEELDLDEGAVSDFLGAPALLRIDLDPMRQPALNIPTTLIHGSLDIRVPAAFSRDYVLSAAKSNIKLIELESAGHFELIDPRHSVLNLITTELSDLT
jgi:acetyl esterase/lipase